MLVVPELESTDLGILMLIALGSPKENSEHRKVAKSLEIFLSFKMSVSI